MSDILFHAIEDAQAIVRKGGVYRQVKVYRRFDKNSKRNRLYVTYGSGYAYITRSMSMLGTSVPKLNVDDIDLPFEPEFDKLGRMVMPEK
jgi:hypothetical protein